jgi:hypothetical protein
VRCLSPFFNQLSNLGKTVGWVERSEPHQFLGNLRWGSLRSTPYEPT